MKRELITRKSEVLGKDMSVLVFGEGGYPVVAFQAQDSKCNNFEDFGMVDTLADYIDNGTIQLFSVDNNDEESWSAADADKVWRADRQEAYFRYVTDELVPLVHEVSGTDARPLAVGCSMGATHAALAALRRPDLFQGCIALSGVYDARYFFGDWMNEVLYDNSVVNFLPNMPEDHPYVALYGARQIVLCVGQGAWEDQGIHDLRIIADACHEKGMDIWCDFWGYDVNHDWPWWKKQIRYFLPIVLDDMGKTLAAEKKPAKRGAAKRTVKKAAAGAKSATTKAKAAAKRTSSAAKAKAEAAAADAEKAVEAAADDVRAGAKKAASGAKTAAKRASASARSAAKKAEAEMEKAAEAAEGAAAEVAAEAKKATTSAKAATRRTASAAKAKAEAAAADAEKKAEEVAGDVKAGAKKAAGTAKTAARRASSRAKAASDKVAVEATEAVEKAAGEAKAVASKARSTAKKAATGATATARKTTAKARAAAKGATE